MGIRVLAPDEVEINARDLFEQGRRVVVMADPPLSERAQIFGDIHLPGVALGVAHGEVAGGPVLLAPHAPASGFAALGEPFNQRRPQSRAQPGELRDELLATTGEPPGREAWHVVTLAHVLRYYTQLSPRGETGHRRRERAAGATSPYLEGRWHPAFRGSRSKTGGRQGARDHIVAGRLRP
ncbi:MAG: hypothetical protein GEV06_17890 [Luteitalea sp.]|nr:hypothetical protein [Luteitalea sp.]